ncbi:hypothetical protein BMF89_00290 [Arthrobacter sp. SRS-W-1-2016]|nr:hypothetical protein BMF89_00290 [Arthrobacter sp. SRS-W-1-2016]
MGSAFAMVSYRHISQARARDKVSDMDTVPGKPADNEQYREVIGFNNQRFNATVPLIELVATRERLEFRARFGFGRFVGPWRVERSQVRRVFRAPGLFSDGIAIQGDNYLDWTIYSFHPEVVLLSLEELGYPVNWLDRY